MIQKYLIVSSLLFSIGITGFFLNRQNIINILMCVELALLAVNINFVAFASHLQDITGQICSIFILTVAAAEVAIGLSILVIYYKQKTIIDLDQANTLKD